MTDHGENSEKLPIVSNDARGSVSHWIAGLRDDDSVAAQQIWNRYFHELVRLAQSHLQGRSREASGEDIALSALKSVMTGVRDGRYPDLVDRISLWPLLVTIAARKAVTQMRRQYAKKRGQGTDVPLADLEAYISDSPTPEFAIEVVDVLEELTKKFNDPNLRLVVLKKLEGKSHQEIAGELGCSTRTVIRKLNLVRQDWEETELGDKSND